MIKRILIGVDFRQPSLAAGSSSFGHRRRPVLVVPTSEAWVPARRPIADRRVRHVGSRVPVPAA